MKLANAIITFLCVLLVTACLTADASAQRERSRRSASKVKLSHLTYKTLTMKSKALKRQVKYSVFLPKGYDAEDNQDTRYPTIFFLHGMWEDHQRFYSRGGAPVLDKMVGDGSIPKVIFICVNDFSRGSFYINGKRMKVEDMVLKEMIPHIAKTYRCKAGRSHRALLGVSMGGFGALKSPSNTHKLSGS